MSEYIKRIRTTTGDKQIDYNALANLPKLVTVDNTLTESGKAADAKAVGDKFKETMRDNDTKYATIVKGHAEGNQVRVSDALATEHSLRVKVHGKNLFHFTTDFYGAANGISITIEPYTSFIRVNGTASIAQAFAIAKSTIELEAGTYTASIVGANDVATSYDRLYIEDMKHGGILVNYIKTDSPRTFTVEKRTEVSVCIIFGEGSSYNNVDIGIQIEKGDTATEYTPHTDPSTTLLTYGENTYAPDANGYVEGLMSSYPYMEMSVPDGFNVFVEYDQDTNTVIKKLTDAIVALGGTV